VHVAEIEAITKACGTHSSPSQDISIIIMRGVCIVRDENGSNHEVATVVSKGTETPRWGRKQGAPQSRDRVLPLALPDDVISPPAPAR
jgi:hypothetical protein